MAAPKGTKNLELMVKEYKVNEGFPIFEEIAR
jgi:hypothetical protein